MIVKISPGITPKQNNNNEYDVTNAARRQPEDMIIPLVKITGRIPNRSTKGTANTAVKKY